MWDLTIFKAILIFVMNLREIQGEGLFPFCKLGTTGLMDSSKLQRCKEK